MNECKSGFLTKQGQKVKSWKKRWTVLKECSLSYFQGKEDTTPVAIIQLHECTVALATYYETKRPFCLKLIAPKRTWYFSGESAEEIMQWLDAIFSWGVRESREEEEIINTLLENTNLVLSGAATIVQCVNSGTIESFREAAKAANARVEFFSNFVQSLSKYGMKMSTGPIADVVKDACNSANQIRDSISALITTAVDARNNPQDSEIKKKLSLYSVSVADKVTAFKKQIQDEERGLKTHLRVALYGKEKTKNSRILVDSSKAPAANLATRNTVNLNTPTSNSPSTYRPNFRSTQLPADVASAEEQQVLFDEMIALSRELTQVMKGMFPEGGTVASGVPPKQGHIIAISLVKAARDYANIHPDPAIRQDILGAAGRTFFATSQLFSPPQQNSEDYAEYSTDDLLKALSQSVVALIKKVLQHHTAIAGLNHPSRSTFAAGSTTSAADLRSGMDLKRSVSVSTMQSNPAPPIREDSGNNLLQTSLSSPALSRTTSTKNVGASYCPTTPPNLITTVEGDVNIWDEKQEEGVNVAFVDDEGLAADGERPIRLGTLNQIVTRLTNEHKPDLRFVKTFITTYQSFTTPEMFLNKIIQRYQVPVSVMEASPLSPLDWTKQKLLPIQLRAYNVLKIWIDSRLSDFDDALITKLGIFINECLRNDGHGKLADQLVLKLKGSVGISRRLNIQLAPKMSTTAFWMRFPGDYFLSLDEDELARQLTLIEFDNYKSIEPKELLNQAWNKPALKHRAVNVLRMISRFNSISYWVARLILGEDRLRQRVKVMTKIIRVAQALYNKNNFNSLLSIMAGLNNSSVHRLKFTSEELSSKDAESTVRFGELLSSDKGYKNYRARVHNINPPLLPYLGVYLTDLTFMEDGNQDNIDGLINFKKREMIFNVIAEIQQYQQTPYKYEPIDSYLSYLSEMPLVEDTKAMDDELYNMSLQREPRNSVKSDIL